MKSSLRLFIGAVALLALAALSRQPWPEFFGLSPSDLGGLAVLFLFGLLAESLWMSIEVGNNAGNSSIIFVPVLVALLLFGPTAALTLALVSGLIGESVFRRKPAVKVLFNVAQYILSACAAGEVYYALGGHTLAASDAESTFLSVLLPFAAFAATFVLTNTASVAGVIALSSNQSFRRVLTDMAGRSGANLFYFVLVSPVAFGIAVLYLHLWIAGLLLALFPLLFVRHSYLTTLNLQRANRDLLRALVKAIETRDPYTSGHSLRVSLLARRIAEGLRLSARACEDIEAAALLHDIGKIDASYADILLKPAELSPDERQKIESHVIRGVELLQSVASFPPSVLAAIRHHHEREDGKGYPDRLKGPEIPMGAKIIKVCDAVDAMLSDRPYRMALSLEEVREQLRLYAGLQFDTQVCALISGSDILEQHAADLALERQLGSSHAVLGPPNISGALTLRRTVATLTSR